jgi:hypothetical protein
MEERIVNRRLNRDEGLSSLLSTPVSMGVHYLNPSNRQCEDGPAPKTVPSLWRAENTIFVHSQPVGFERLKSYLSLAPVISFNGQQASV